MPIFNKYQDTEFYSVSFYIVLSVTFKVERGTISALSFNSEIVARDFAISKSDVYRWDKADRLSNNYKSLFNTGDIKLSTAEILGSLPEEVQDRIWKVSGGKKLTAEQAGKAKATLAMDDEITDEQLKFAIFEKDKKPTVKQPPVRYKAHIYDWDKLTPEEREKFVIKALEAYSADARAKAMHQKEQEMTEQSLLDAGQQQLPLDEEDRAKAETGKQASA